MSLTRNPPRNRGVAVHFCTRRHRPRRRLYTQTALWRSLGPKSPSRSAYLSRSCASREVSEAHESRGDRATAEADLTAELRRRLRRTEEAPTGIFRVRIAVGRVTWCLDGNLRSL